MSADDDNQAEREWEFHLEKLGEIAAKLDTGDREKQKELARQAVAAALGRPVARQPGQNVPPTKILNCDKCGTVNEFAEPNMPDGSYRCYSCR
jgi:hypothetical protein